MVTPTTSSPVFVDSTGRRRRLLQRASYAFGALCMLYGGLVSVSLAGGPVSPNSVLPLQALADGGAEVAPPPEQRPSPIPTPAKSAAAAKKAVSSDPLRRRPAEPAHVLERAPAPKPPAAKPSKTKAKPAKSTPTPRPVESATTTPAASPSSTPPPSTVPTTKAPVPPKPPAVSADSGGAGGGEVVEETTDEPETPQISEEPDAGVASPTPTPTSSAGGAEVAE